MNEDMYPSSAFHYTSLSSMIQIIQMRSLWASDARYLNDSEEIKFGLGVLKKLLEESAEWSNAEWQHVLAEVRRAIDNPVALESEPYVISFTQHGDSLEMWRSYGRDGGCSIEFDLSVLDDVIGNEQIACGDRLMLTKKECADMVESNMMLRSRIQRVMYGEEGGRRLFMTLLDDCRGNLRSPSQDAIISFSSFIKHGAFKSEDEIRLLIQSASCMNSKVPVREARGHLVPYRTVTFPYAAVKSITIGPSPYRERTISALNRFLYSPRGEWSGVEVRTSSIPYLA